MHSFSLINPYGKVKLNKSKKREVFIVFIAFVVLPGSFFGLIPLNLIRIYGFIDKNVLIFFVSILFFITQSKYLIQKNIFKTEHYFKILSFYVFLYFIITILFFHNSFIGTLKVFRYNYYIPVSILSLILYFKNRHIDTLKYFIQLFYYYALINLFIYIIVVIGFPALINNITSNTLLGSANDKYTNNLYPKFNAILLFLSFYKVLRKRDRFSIVISLIILIVDLNMGVRSIIALDFFIIIFIIFFYLKKAFMSTVIKLFLISFFIIFALVFTNTKSLFKNSVTKIDRISTGIKYGNLDTYGFRLSLIAYAVDRTEKDGNILFGRGYKRTSYRGDYDIALGGDSPVAAILITEGLFGLILRLLFFIYIHKDKRRFNKHFINDNKFVILFINCFTLFAFINIVQTTTITIYLGTPLIMVLFVIYLQKNTQIIISSNQKTSLMNT